MYNGSFSSFSSFNSFPFMSLTQYFCPTSAYNIFYISDLTFPWVELALVDFLRYIHHVWYSVSLI